jgi:hypothetical protein
VSQLKLRGSNLHMHILVKTAEMTKSAPKVKSSNTQTGKPHRESETQHKQVIHPSLVSERLRYVMTELMKDSTHSEAIKRSAHQSRMDWRYSDDLLPRPSSMACILLGRIGTIHCKRCRQIFNQHSVIELADNGQQAGHTLREQASIFGH